MSNAAVTDLADPAEMVRSAPAQAAAPSGAPEIAYLTPGTQAYRRANLALLLAGFATFSLLYCVQPLLPLFSRDFQVSPAASSLSLSFTTGFLAVSIFVGGLCSDRLNRRTLMTVSLCASALLNLLAAAVPSWHALLLIRALEGVALGGLPAVAMAYVAEEVHPQGLGFAMGLYVGGTAFGGMAGRIISGTLADLFSWHVALGAIGALGIATGVAFFLLLPPSRHFVPARTVRWHDIGHALRTLLEQPGLAPLFAMGFVLMGGFVTVYNYIGYRLVAPPYNLSQTVIGLIFVVYLVGMVSSTWSGRMADRHGRARMLSFALALMAVGGAMTLMRPLIGVIVGIVLLTFGFFAGHAVASGWVGRLASRSKGMASSLYLLAYYVGSSMVGSLGGRFLSSAGWPGVIGLVWCVLALGFVLTWQVARKAGPGRA
jgi:MFS transporter, YNFM family, putative membrane transport protein